MYKKMSLYYNTIKYLKPSQIYWRIYYKLRHKCKQILGLTSEILKDSKNCKLDLKESILYQYSYTDDTFTFLNKSKNFQKKIDWDYLEYGKLWCYNLNYFEYLDNISKEDGIKLIYDFIQNIENNKIGLEAFPISLRGINWIKFLIKHNIKDKKIDDSLYAQYYILKDNFELHLLGNHLLENAFSLFIGAYYFHDKILYKQAKYYLQRELDEQILDDGGHFELSPMYHQLMLFRLLDCINIVKYNNLFNQELLKYLEDKAIIMLEWLDSMTYKNGDIPLFNDSTFNIAPKSSELFDYAKRLKIKWNKKQTNFISLKNSGYYKYKRGDYELIIDIGNIGPDYIPGHAHCDIFNFELYYKSKPIIVDTGTSTYENNSARASLRSTKSHNTVMINETEQSEIWGSFRVAKRAKIYDIEVNQNKVSGKHNGYIKKFGLIHKREFIVKDNKILIIDTLNKSANAKAYLHFHPSCKIELVSNYILINNEIKILLSSQDYLIEEYFYQPRFNTYIKSKKLVINFKNKLEMEILFENS